MALKFRYVLLSVSRCWSFKTIESSLKLNVLFHIPVSRADPSLRNRGEVGHSARSPANEFATLSPSTPFQLFKE